MAVEVCHATTPKGVFSMGLLTRNKKGGIKEGIGETRNNKPLQKQGFI